MYKTTRCWLDDEWRARNIDDLQGHISRIVMHEHFAHVEAWINVREVLQQVYAQANPVKEILISRLQSLDMRGRRWLS